VVHRAGSWLSAHGPIVAAAVVVLLVVLTTVGADRNARRTGVAADDRTEMARADAAIDSLRALAWHDERAAAGAPATLSDEGLIALAYVARANLGLGSPFRVAAFAQRDPRLTPETARLATWAVLARVARGATYAIDSTTLRTSADAVPLGVQLATITRAIETARRARRQHGIATARRHHGDRVADRRVDVGLRERGEPPLLRELRGPQRVAHDERAAHGIGIVGPRRRAAARPPAVDRGRAGVAARVGRRSGE
jgi:hypothetical protein